MTDLKKEMGNDPFHPNHDYGEGREWLGEIIPKLTDEQKKEIHSHVLLTRAAEPKHITEETFRKNFAFCETFGREAFILKIQERDKKQRENRNE